MAISGKYGQLDISRIGKDEPVFILRAQDKLAEPAIEMYRLLAASHGSKVVGARHKKKLTASGNGRALKSYPIRRHLMCDARQDKRA